MDPTDRYRRAGVDIDAAHASLVRVEDAITATHGRAVLSRIGAFGGLYSMAGLRSLEEPVLVASTDGVGTKVKLASRLDRYESLGLDIVHHCVNDILVQGARPLFFLDYVAVERLDPTKVSRVIGGVAQACRAVGCALLGGETAEMPGVYQPGEMDLVGTIVGVVERAAVIDGRAIEPGDTVVGLRSSGLHTNGYSLARELCGDVDLGATLPELGQSLGDALLAPHRCYLGAIEELWGAGVSIHAMAHITGGGLVDNPARILPEGLAMDIHMGSWPRPPLFGWLQRAGDIPEAQMARVFNLGLGMLLVLSATDAQRALQRLGSEALVVGTVVERGDGPPVRLVRDERGRHP